jgi:hypothetical protein
MAQAQDLAPTRLADQLERAFWGGAWHGPAVMELLSGVDAALAQWRPGPPAHTIAETVGHLAHWMEDSRRQILGEPHPVHGAGGDWGPAALASEEAWQALCATLEDAHCRLRTAVLQLEEGQLDLARSGSDTTVRGLLLGTLQHTAYHAGQVALVRHLGEGALGRRP